jgi:hypothetical protein
MFIIIHLYYYVIYFKFFHYLKSIKYYNIYTYCLIQNLLTHV